MSAKEATLERRGCLLGLAVGDALGTAVEFQPRGSFPPLTDETWLAKLSQAADIGTLAEALLMLTPD